MNLTDYNYLAYFHDAALVCISFFKDDKYNSNIKVVVRCDEDCGYDKWAGKIINVLFTNIIVCNCSIFGYVANEDAIDRISEGVQRHTRREINKLTGVGIIKPEILLTMLLRSGSIFELGCDNIDISIQ